MLTLRALRLAVALLAPIWAAEARAATTCNSNDPLCNPPPSDPCASFSGVDYNNCKFSLPQCVNMAGPVLQTCLAHAVQQVGGATLTRTNTSTSTVTNRATTFTAVKYADDLFNDQANSGNQNGNYTVQVNGNSVQTVETVGSGTFLSQTDALNAQHAVMTGCVGTNLSGRTDALCAATPNDPECTGMSSSLFNATTCAVKGPPDPKGNPTCLQYGGFGYTLDEWLVFSQQYYNGMTGCFRVGDTADTTGATADPNKMVNRADRLQALNDFAALPTAGALGNGNVSGASQVTGQINNSQITSKGKNQVVPFWQSISAKFDDGAAALGFERGELVKRSAGGESFANAFSESPFGASLEKSMRDSVEIALSDPAATMEKIKERSSGGSTVEVADGGTKAESAAIVSASDPGASKSATAAEASAAPSQANAPVGAASGKSSSSRVISGARTPASSSPAPTPSARELAYERAGLGGSARAGLMAGKPPGAALESAASTAETTLFQRVSLSYRRHTSQLKPLDDSNTARELRNMEKPAFFRDL